MTLTKNHSAETRMSVSFAMSSRYMQGYGHIAERYDEGGGRSPKFNYELIDRVKVPAGIAGEYMLSWRWDTEQKSQVWSACADITIV